MKIGFTKVLLLSFNRKATGGTAKFAAALTKNVIEAMGWDEAPDWQKQSTPEGKLIASMVQLTPKHSDLARHALELESTLVDGFQIVRKEAKGKGAKKTGSVRTELHFTVHFSDNTGARKLEQYILTVNTDAGLTVTYEKEAEQTTIEEVVGDSKQGELEEMVKEVGGKRTRAAKDVQ